MKKITGFVFAALVVLAVAPAVLAQPAAPSALAKPLTATAPSPAAPAALPVPAEQATPQKPPRPAKAPEAAKPPEGPSAPQPARAPDAAPAPDALEDPVNVRFEVTVSSQTGNAAAIKRSALVTVANGTRGWASGGGMLRSGNSVPVPQAMYLGDGGKEPPAARPMTSYNYRSVGLNVDASQVSVLPSNRVRAILNIEFSGLDDKVTSAPAPSFPTFSQRLALFLENGKPLVVAQSSDFVDNAERKQTVEVKATILR